MSRTLRIVLAGLCALTVACASGNQAAPASDDDQVSSRDVSFATSDGVRLTGRLFGSGRVGITLAHMFPADATSWYEVADDIAGAGYMVLAFNFRGHADAEGERDLDKANIDMEAAKDYLAAQGAKTFAFVGASMGGTASLVAAEAIDTLAIVTLSAPLRFMGLDAASVAGRIQRPVLLIAAEGDTSAFNDLGILERTLPNPDTRVFDGNAHGTDLLTDRPESIEEIIGFLERYAPTRRPDPTPIAE